MKPLLLYQVLRPREGVTAPIATPCRYLGQDASGTRAALISLTFASEIATPFYVSRSELIEQIEDGAISQSNFFSTGIPASEESLSESSREHFEHIWSVFEPEFSPDRLHRMIFDAEYRKLYLEKLCRKVPSTRTLNGVRVIGVSYKQCLRYFFRFLWAGGLPLSLALSYERSGSTDQKQEALTHDGKGTAKRGQKGVSEVPLPEVRDLLKKGAIKFFHEKNFTLRMSYWYTLEKYFPKSGYWTTDSRGAKVWELYNPAATPSQWQFRYVTRETESGTGTTRLRKMHTRLEPATVKSSKNSPKRDISMAGERVEVDASKFQIKVASSLGRDRILKPLTPYIGIDRASGAAVGYALSSENASLKVSLELLDNCMTPKSEIFDRLGLPYTDDDWPSLLPSVLAVDRGELASNKAVHVVAGGCVIKVMPAMMSNWKGVVENRWDQIKERLARAGTAGVHSKIIGRRQNDGIQSSCLIPIEVERRLVQLLLDINNEAADPELIPPEMLGPGVKSVSKLEVLKWLLANRPGATRELSDQERIEHLMMRAAGSITSRGILYKKIVFTADHLHSSGLTKLAASGRLPVSLRYRENLADWVWYRDPISNEWKPAEIDNQNLVNRKISFSEAILHAKTVAALSEATNDSAAVRAISHEKEHKTIESSARRKASAARKASGATRSSMKKGRSDNTALETVLERSIADADLRSHVQGLKHARDTAIPAPVILEQPQAPKSDRDNSLVVTPPSAADIALRAALEFDDE